MPFCTLKSFPNQIEHCIEWARDFSFGGLFMSKPMQWNQLIDESHLVERLNSPHGGGLDLKIVRTSVKLLRDRPKDFADCVRFARLKYEAYFVNKTKQLLYNFPLDHKIDEKGSMFAVDITLMICSSLLAITQETSSRDPLRLERRSCSKLCSFIVCTLG